jgi:hypothetical protein
VQANGKSADIVLGLLGVLGGAPAVPDPLDTGESGSAGEEGPADALGKGLASHPDASILSHIHYLQISGAKRKSPNGLVDDCKGDCMIYSEVICRIE